MPLPTPGVGEELRADSTSSKGLKSAYQGFVMSKNPYEIEEMTSAEYEQLVQLFEDVDPADIDDMDLYEVGGHRNLYNYLTKTMGLSVQAGRGPVWHRARALIDKYQLTHRPGMPADDPNK